MSTIHITKLQAAENQLATAVRLYFSGADPVSIHTLTCAAYDVLHDIGKPRGLEPIFKGALFVPVKQRERYRDHLNRPRNFFKHADLDPHTRLHFDPEITVFLLFDACEFYRQLTGENPRPLEVFTWYFQARYPQFIVDPEARRLAANHRREFGLEPKERWLSLLPSSSAC